MLVLTVLKTLVIALVPLSNLWREASTQQVAVAITGQWWANVAVHHIADVKTWLIPAPWHGEYSVPNPLSNLDGGLSVELAPPVVEPPREAAVPARLVFTLPASPTCAAPVLPSPLPPPTTSTRETSSEAPASSEYHSNDTPTSQGTRALLFIIGRINPYATIGLFAIAALLVHICFGFGRVRMVISARVLLTLLKRVWRPNNTTGFPIAQPELADDSDTTVHPTLVVQESSQALLDLSMLAGVIPQAAVAPSASGSSGALDAPVTQTAVASSSRTPAANPSTSVLVGHAAAPAAGAQAVGVVQGAGVPDEAGGDVAGLIADEEPELEFPPADLGAVGLVDVAVGGRSNGEVDGPEASAHAGTGVGSEVVGGSAEMVVIEREEAKVLAADVAPEDLVVVVGAAGDLVAVPHDEVEGLPVEAGTLELEGARDSSVECSVGLFSRPSNIFAPESDDSDAVLRVGPTLKSYTLPLVHAEPFTSSPSPCPPQRAMRAVPARRTVPPPLPPFAHHEPAVLVTPPRLPRIAAPAASQVVSPPEWVDEHSEASKIVAPQPVEKDWAAPLALSHRARLLTPPPLLSELAPPASELLSSPPRKKDSEGLPNVFAPAAEMDAPTMATPLSFLLPSPRRRVPLGRLFPLSPCPIVNARRKARYLAQHAEASPAATAIHPSAVTPLRRLRDAAGQPSPLLQHHSPPMTMADLGSLPAPPNGPTPRPPPPGRTVHMILEELSREAQSLPKGAEAGVPSLPSISGHHQEAAAERVMLAHECREAKEAGSSGLTRSAMLDARYDIKTPGTRAAIDADAERFAAGDPNAVERSLLYNHPRLRRPFAYTNGMGPGACLPPGFGVGGEVLVEEDAEEEAENTPPAGKGKGRARMPSFMPINF
ncbi:hypothetical protein B0H16DRAFT_1566983 [Mycena metata]|uniref:Uncharacterized protein n=1 Tax=Mycena metata TaxID=1033252 RepID=A0AAD7N021_9AGAR|nr:hypothetical protein B0H16DRAFT_1566983 [Mycena metata]